MEIWRFSSLWKRGFEIEFVNSGRVSKALVKENKNYQVNTLENKSIAKIFTIAQLKEFLDIHENTIIKTFTNRIKNLESKIKGEMKALQEPTEFQNETYEKMKSDITEEKQKLETRNKNDEEAQNLIQ